MNVTDVLERFVEAVRQFPFLYDKTHPEFKDKQAKMNRWDIIGTEFALTGDQAELKFKNMKDRWVKIVTAHDAKQKSGAPGKAAKLNTKWPLFEVVNSVLKNAPCYAKKTTNNIPDGEASVFLPSTQATISDTSEVSAGSSTSTAQQLLQDIYSEPADLSFEDDDDEPASSNSPAAALPPRSATRTATTPSSSRKRKLPDDFEAAVQGVLGDCSVNMKALAARSSEVDTEANVGNYVAARLRLLPKKVQCEAINEIHNVLHKAEMSLYE